MCTLKDADRNEINIGDEVWFTFDDSLKLYKGKVISLDEDFGKAVIKDKSGKTYERIVWDILDVSNTISQENNNNTFKKICVTLWNSEDGSIVKSFDLDEFYGADELRIKL